MIEESPGADCQLDAPEHCITCADEGVVVAVLRADGATALCAGEDGGRQSVAIELVAPVSAGDELLVHAGVAIRRLGAPA
ncbi:MAG: HypC/HybG/HupF family hydrogenase formation chaperone [Solirubrobacteraceae bacterium]